MRNQRRAPRTKSLSYSQGLIRYHKTQKHAQADKKEKTKDIKNDYQTAFVAVPHDGSYRFSGIVVGGGGAVF